MKIFKNISIQLLLVFLAVMATTMSCKETAPFRIDPVVPEAPFTFQPGNGFPGQVVLIRGANLAVIQKVSFGLTEGVIKEQSDSLIKVEIPVGATSDFIRLVKADGVITAVTRFTVDLVPVPNVIRFIPSVAGSGDTITVEGNLLNQVDSVHIGDLNANIITPRTDSIIQIVAPVGLQTGPIRLFYKYMTHYGVLQTAVASSSGELVLSLPVITSFTPVISAINVGDTIRIHGDKLDLANSVRFATANATILSQSPSEISVIVPPNIVSGRVILVAEDGQVESSTNFGIILPQISSFSPARAAVIEGGGTRFLSISGSILDRVTRVDVGNATATILTQTANHIAISVLGTASGLFTLHTANGNVVSTGMFIPTGEFWVTNFDQTFTPNRFTRSGWEQVQSTVRNLTVFSRGDERVNYGSTTAILSGTSAHWPRFSIRADDQLVVFPGSPAPRPAPDRFQLYAASSVGTFLEFDLNLEEVPDGLISDTINNLVRVKLVIAGTTPVPTGSPWGHAIMLAVPADPTVWTPFRINTNLMPGGTFAEIVTSATIPALGAQRWVPNQNRFIGLVFVDGNNNPAVAGQRLTVNVDNVRFVIE